ncbi:uncharacterized protein LOC123530293 [Mercenaria mercenaria]|uniref:uncharacterized protein LOC123530293 n=1 Tax=Mercenaria mercenaria TaxID=6596 RepID=UPI00234EE293|nr:uncharacterized protein LOC123530293 [Mercenaria mercenaria]
MSDVKYKHILYCSLISYRDAKEALESLQQKRDGELLREMTTDSLRNLRDDGENIISSNMEWPGQKAAEQEQKILEEEGHIPSDFSDATTEDDIDLSKLTPAQRRQYLAEKERRRKEREKRRREKYGDKYDEIMKKKNAKKYEELAQKIAGRDAEEQKRKEEREKEKDRLGVRRRSSNASSISRPGGRPRSMVTYDKGPPRDLGHDSKRDNREIGLAHDDWAPRDRRPRKGSDASESSDAPPKLHRETTMLKPLPTITQGKIYEDDKNSTLTSRTSKSYKRMTDDEEDRVSDKVEKSNKEETDGENEARRLFEVGPDGKIRLKGKKIDLSKLSLDDLRALGIDPNLSAKEIAKQLKKLFGDDIQVSQGDVVIGTKGIGDYSREVSDNTLARDPNLDVDSLTGVRRVNVIMRRGGAALQQHLEKVISLSRLVDKYAKDLDERDADIDFLSHYRLVEKSKLDTYARAFVVEDSDLDTVLKCNEAKVALDGVPSIQHITNKQMEYVLKVLKIDEATLVTFRMFAVVTALCERVTHMDSLSQRLLEICNLADIERKLDLYKAMFYTNTESDRDSNFITSESLKIELIAGGLNWKQQQYIMEKMEPNDFGDISFLDYMCYIPLFLSMHDNICYNPLDMSNEKYTQPPRERPPSVQRDMNPLGNKLTKQSAYQVRKRAMEMMQATNSNAVQVSKSYMDILNKYKTERYTRLKKFEDQRFTSMKLKEKSSSLDSKSDMIY